MVKATPAIASGLSEKARTIKLLLVRATLALDLLAMSNQEKMPWWAYLIRPLNAILILALLMTVGEILTALIAAFR